MYSLIDDTISTDILDSLLGHQTTGGREERGGKAAWKIGLVPAGRGGGKGGERSGVTGGASKHRHSYLSSSWLTGSSRRCRLAAELGLPLLSSWPKP